MRKSVDVSRLFSVLIHDSYIIEIVSYKQFTIILETFFKHFYSKGKEPNMFEPTLIYHNWYQIAHYITDRKQLTDTVIRRKYNICN